MPISRNMNLDNTKDLLVKAEEVAAVDVHEAKELGYMARSMVQATLPHRATSGCEFVRTNGYYTLSLLAPSAVGLPFGSMPRLLLAWVSSEAVISKCRTLELGRSLSGFMHSLGYTATGGRWGSIPRLRQQMHRLFSCAISCVNTNPAHQESYTAAIASQLSLWWDPKTPDQPTLFGSTITLSQDFFEDVTNNVVPMDMRALKALKQSPMALDIYMFLVLRLSYLRKSTVIPWQSLEAQFGSEYARARDFKSKFLTTLSKVLMFYPDAKVEPNQAGLLLLPSKLLIKRRFQGALYAIKPLK